MFENQVNINIVSNVKFFIEFKSNWNLPWMKSNSIKKQKKDFKYLERVDNINIERVFYPRKFI